jgi:hypothetical protein
VAVIVLGKNNVGEYEVKQSWAQQVEDDWNFGASIKVS